MTAANGSGSRGKLARVLWTAHPARPRGEYELLEQSQWWPPEKLEAFRLRALGRLFAAAIRVPFYRDRFAAAGIQPDRLRGLEELSRVAPLEREDLKRLGVNGLRAPRAWGIRASSSGSIDSPVKVLWTLDQMRWLDASERRGRAWLGIELGDRKLDVRCRRVPRLHALNAELLNTRAVDALSLTDPAVTEGLIDSLQRRPPALVQGVSNAVYAVALALIESGRAVQARACWIGGNHLHPHYRRAFEAAFRCPAYERYAAIETGVIAHQCREAGSLHVPAEGVIAEIVRADGSPADPGEEGEVLVTLLRNRGMPLIRYRIGDRAIAPESHRCECGRALPVFGTVVGRSGDFLRTRSGARVSPREVVEAVRPALDGVIDFQVIQDRDARLRVLVTQRESHPPEPDRERIAAALSRLVQPPERPRVERVDVIPLTPGGKVRTLLSSAGPPPQR